MACKIRRVGHLELRVEDIERSKRFFPEIMGFPVVRQSERGMIFCRTDTSDNHHMLALVPATQGAAMPTPDQVGTMLAADDLPPGPRVEQDVVAVAGTVLDDKVPRHADSAYR